MVNTILNSSSNTILWDGITIHVDESVDEAKWQKTNTR